MCAPNCSLVLMIAVAAVFISSASDVTAADLHHDQRLEQRINLRAEAIPVREVVRELSRVTGVPLRADGRTGDERLVAFAPSTRAVEVLDAIADLYRLEWTHQEIDGRNGYRLVALPARLREEQNWRQRSIDRLLEHLSQASGSGPTGGRTGEAPASPWAPSYRDLLPVISRSRNDILRTGYLQVPVRSLPVVQRQRIEPTLQPIVDAQYAWLQEVDRQSRERELAEGRPPSRMKGIDGPPPLAGQCLISSELLLKWETQQPYIRVALVTPTGIRFGVFEAVGADLGDAAFELYRDRNPRLPQLAGGQPPERNQVDERLNRVVMLANDQARRPRDWISQLGMLSDASRLAIFTDCYSRWSSGTPQPRGDLSGMKAKVSTVLDALCFPRSSNGSEDLAPNSFWWSRGNSVLVRSRGWLWESGSTIPVSVLDDIAESVRLSGQISPVNLSRIASLQGLQILGHSSMSGHWNAWHGAVKVPADFTLAARRLLLAEGVSWSQLADVDQRRVLSSLAVAVSDPSRYAARLRTSIVDVPEDGGAMAQIRFQSSGSTQFGTGSIYLPLPGRSPNRQLRKQGLAITRAEAE